MGTKHETREVKYCDVCKREYDGIMDTCLVCEREFCRLCQANVREYAYFNRGDLCKECRAKPIVKDVQESFRALYWAFQKKEKEWFAKIKTVLQEKSYVG